jgi:hypothetical protein
MGTWRNADLLSLVRADAQDITDMAPDWAVHCSSWECATFIGLTSTDA